MKTVMAGFGTRRAAQKPGCSTSMRRAPLRHPSASVRASANDGRGMLLRGVVIISLGNRIDIRAGKAPAARRVWRMMEPLQFWARKAPLTYSMFDGARRTLLVASQ